jgi:hypothetical protein
VCLQSLKKMAKACMDHSFKWAVMTSAPKIGENEQERGSWEGLGNFKRI